MAGTLYGLPLSQRIDLNGKPSVGWLLYLYQANTSTPVTSYQDTALTVVNPWPLQADAYGMMRQFWLADGSYRARATSLDGSITYFDQQTILAIGPSTGAAPSGGVDATAIFQTGDVMWLDRQGTRTGWVRDNGKTIGPAGAGPTEPGGSGPQAQPLFEFLWNNFDQTTCPVTPSRGASSLADWTSGTKVIATPDKRGYILGGLDDMGSSAASRYSGVPITLGSATTAGAVLGENLHTMLISEMAAHQHGAFINDPTHAHTSNAAQTTGFTIAGGGIAGPSTTVATINAAATGVRVKSSSGGGPDDLTASVGGGGAHNTVQKTVLGTFYRKL